MVGRQHFSDTLVTKMDLSLVWKRSKALWTTDLNLLSSLLKPSKLHTSSSLVKGQQGFSDCFHAKSQLPGYPDWVLTHIVTLLPWWLSGKTSACHCRRCWFDPWVGKIPWRRKWQPTPVFLPGKLHGQRSLAGYSPWGHKEMNMTKQLSTHKEIKITMTTQ